MTARRKRSIRFDEAFDGPAWPGPLGETGREAVFGEAWLGPRGLVALLETDLGLGGTHVSDAERAAALLSSLEKRDGYWRRSFDVDRLGTARRLLFDRDALWMAGWRGQAVSSRLGELFEATAPAPAGFSDRLRAVAEALESREVDLGEVELLEPLESLPLLWQEVFQRLVGRGVEVKQRPLAAQPAEGDLGAAREVPFEPRADGSLQLLRPYGPLAAAEEVAAWLAARESLAGCVVVGADGVLDRALERHGLPGTGAARADDLLLELLPLSVEMGWSPPDPARAFELLSIPDGPIPRPLAARLLRALQKTPAVESDRWRERLAEGLGEIEQEERRIRVKGRVEELFRPAARWGMPYPAQALFARTRLLSMWAAAREQKANGEGGRFSRVRAQCQAFERFVEVAGLEALSAADLQRWLDLAKDAVSPGAPAPAQAGLGATSRPDGIAGPARCVIWWGFERSAAPQPEPLALSREERCGLEEKGVRLMDPGARAVALARRWRRPLLQTSEALLLVCPERGDDGERLYPHPLWDEIEAGARSRARKDASEALVRPRPDLLRPAPQTQVARRALPIPRRRFSIPPGSLGPRPVESPSGLVSLLGCSFQWALKYHGRLGGSLAEAPADLGPLLYGNVAHAVLEGLAREAPLAPKDAAERAGHLFDAHLPRAAAALELPGHEFERADLRHRISLAAQTLFQILADRGAEVRSAETPYRRPALGSQLEGRPDLVLSSPDLVIDLKYGRADDRARELRRGTALQLAAYSFLAAESGALPRGAYFILHNQELLERSEVLPEETWTAAEAGAKGRLGEIARGILYAEAVTDGGAEAPGDDVLEDGVLHLAPPCRYCKFDGLCGVGLEGER